MNKIISLKPITTEKAIMMIETQNVLSFETEKENKKDDIKKEIENLFETKIDKIKTLIRGNKKNIYAKLKKEFPAIDIATKLGLM
jgi:large subunit ribosomal protein L23